jgi:hypothetical protein
VLAQVLARTSALERRSYKKRPLGPLLDVNRLFGDLNL